MWKSRGASWKFCTPEINLVILIENLVTPCGKSPSGNLVTPSENLVTPGGNLVTQVGNLVTPIGNIVTSGIMT